MDRIRDVCSHIRSKNAGPFWITIDLFFSGETEYRRYRDTLSLNAALFTRLYGADPRFFKRVAVDSLRIIKISYPRPHPQGWLHERDMHSGQQFVPLLHVALAPGIAPPA